MAAQLSRVLLALVFLAFGSYARAQSVTLHEALTGFARQGNAFVRVESALGSSAGARVWQAALSAGGDIVATDAVVLAGPAGNLSVQAASRVGIANAARAMATAALLPEAMAVGTALAVGWAAYRIYSDATGSLKIDPGVDTTSSQVTCYRGPFSTGYPSRTACISTLASAASADWDQNFTQQGYAANYNKGGISCVQATRVCTATMTNKFSGAPSTFDFAYGAETTTQQSCPQSVDASNPANTIPAGSPPGPDGRCPTARYNHSPISADDAAAKIVANPGYMTPGQELEAVKQAVSKGVGVQSTPGAITGPASQTGTPATTTTTTQSPSGTPQTDTKTVTPVYNYTYAPTSITINEGSTTVTNHSDGSTTTESTTTPGGTTVPDDPCTKFPDRAGCREMGTPPDPEPIPTDNRQVQFTPESGFGSDSASCPALVHTASVGNVDVFGLFCQYLSGIRFAVVGVAWIIGAMIFIGRVD